MKEDEIAHDGREEETGLRARGLRPARPTPGSYRAPEESRVYLITPSPLLQLEERGASKAPARLPHNGPKPSQRGICMRDELTLRPR